MQDYIAVAISDNVSLCLLYMWHMVQLDLNFTLAWSSPVCVAWSFASTSSKL